jgi:hypothetical protein
MFENPNVGEWISGLLAAIVSIGLVAGLSAVLVFLIAKIWGDDGTPVLEERDDAARQPMPSVRQRIGA